MTDSSYPPEPWRLRGRLWMSVWRVPRARLPALPQGLSPVVVGGAGLVGTAWVAYGAGSVLKYNELLAAVLVTRQGRPRVCITHIWVDSRSSRQGGRELWGIPKEMATLRLPSTGRLRFEAPGIAAASMTGRLDLPGVWPLRWRVAQSLRGELRDSRVRVRARVVVGSSSWHIERSGPLGWLHGCRPLCSAGLRGFDMWFGSAPAS